MTTPHDLVRAAVAEDHRPAGAVRIVKERVAGDDAAFAVAFEDRDGYERRGVIGLHRTDGGWTPSGGFMDSVRVTGDRDLWTTSGGWGHPGDGRAHAVYGGWIAGTVAVTARVTDVDGGTLEDRVENGVVLFLYRGLTDPRLDLFDADGRIVRSGPLFSTVGRATRRR